MAHLDRIGIAMPQGLELMVLGVSGQGDRPMILFTILADDRPRNSLLSDPHNLMVLSRYSVLLKCRIREGGGSSRFCG